MEYDENGTNLLWGMTDAAAVDDLRARARGHDIDCASRRSPRVFCTCGRAAIAQALRVIEATAGTNRSA
ncbi:MAG: hypothetical protein R2706_10905 [Acidimicrobiales bacterium]